MTNVQEALNVVEQALLNAIAVMENKTELTTTQRESRKAAAITQCKNALMELECKSALSEIEKSEPVAEVTAQWVIDFIGSNYNSMRTHDEQGKELPHEQITYSLTVHDLLSAFAYTSPQPIEKCEPVGELSVDYQGFSSYKSLKDLPNGYHKLYTSPQPRDWVGLKISDDELLKYAVSEELLLFAGEDDFLTIANGVLELVNIKLNTKG